MNDSNVQVYFVHCKYLYQLMMTFSVCRHVNWTQNGLKITLCQYYKVGQFWDVDSAMKLLTKWDGNDVTNKIGRSVLRVGDIFRFDGVSYLFVCKRLIKIPQTIADRIIIREIKQ